MPYSRLRSSHSAIAHSGGSELPTRGTPAFYREEAARLTLIACDVSDPVTRLELMEIAASFRKLADFVIAHYAGPELADSKLA